MTDLAATYGPKAAAAISRFAATATLTRTTPGAESIDPETYTIAAAPDSVTVTPLKVILKQEVIGTNDNGHRLYGTVALTVTELRQGDVLTIAGQDYRVNEVRELSPQGVAIMYTAVVS